MKKEYLLPGILGISLLALVSCTEKMAYAPPSPQPVVMVESSSMMLASTATLKTESAASRGIIGTEEGTYESGTRTTKSFVRLNKVKPDGILVMDYRDESKISKSGLGRIQDLRDSSGMIKVKFVKDSFWSSTMPVYSYVGKNPRPTLLGKKGQEYSIEIENTTDSALEVVVSIDGLNTTTKQKASFKSPGYIVDPESKITVRGWTANNYGGLARFKFSDLDSSVSAQKAGQETVPDIGTIGFAVFKSKASANAATRGRAFAEM